MMRRRILHTLLAASFGALAMAAVAQPATQAPNDSPRNAPLGDAVAPPVVGSPAPMAPAYPATNAPTPAMNTGMPHDMSEYKAERAACNTGSMSSQDECRKDVNMRYSNISPKCKKLSGSILDDCLKGADTGGK
jgi:hypothetical protein